MHTRVYAWQIELELQFAFSYSVFFTHHSLFSPLFSCELSLSPLAYISLSLSLSSFFSFVGFLYLYFLDFFYRFFLSSFFLLICHLNAMLQVFFYRRSTNQFLYTWRLFLFHLLLLFILLNCIFLKKKGRSACMCVRAKWLSVAGITRCTSACMYWCRWRKLNFKLR